jgi:hypothetical protein
MVFLKVTDTGRNVLQENLNHEHIYDPQLCAVFSCLIQEDYFLLLLFFSYTVSFRYR